MTISLDIVSPGSIGNYTDLVAKVALWLDRDDLGERIPDFVALLEARLNRLLRTVLQETLNTIWAPTSAYYSLPDDFRKIRSLSVRRQDAYPYYPGELIEVSPQALMSFNGGEYPRAYAIEGRQLHVVPAPTSEKPLVLDVNYWRRIPPLGTFQPTNWILQEHPDIYVWGALHQGAIYIRDPEAENACSNLLDQAIGELKTMSRQDQYGGPIAPQTAVQVRGARA